MLGSKISRVINKCCNKTGLIPSKEKNVKISGSSQFQDSILLIILPFLGTIEITPLLALVCSAVLTDVRETLNSVAISISPGSNSPSLKSPLNILRIIFFHYVV